jgi:hypothetical protein
MKRLTILFMVISNIVFAQQTNNNTSFKDEAFLELLGNGGYASINFQRIVIQQHRFSLGISAGISTFKIKDFDQQFNPDLIVPVTARLYYGGRRHKVFAGIGQTISSTSHLDVESFKPKRSYALSANFVAGYRYDFKRVMLQLAYTPILEDYHTFHHWFGLAVGFKF